MVAYPIKEISDDSPNVISENVMQMAKSFAKGKEQKTFEKFKTRKKMCKFVVFQV